MNARSDLIARAIHLDRPTLDGFDSANLCEAARYRLAKLARRGSFDGKLDWEKELPLLDALHVEPAQSFTEGPDGQDPWSYLLFADGSLYDANNAQDEVWGCARDFITERLLRDKAAEDYSPESAEGRLIRVVAPDYL